MARRRRRKRPGRLIFACLVLLAGGLCVLKNMASYTPKALPPAAPVQAAEAKQAVAQARKTVSGIARAAEQGKRKPFHVHITDDELTTFAASDSKIKARLRAKGMKDPRFVFENGRVTVSGFMTYHDKKAYVTLCGRPVAGADGRVKLANISVKLGKLSAPMLAGKAQEMFDDMFRSGELKLPADVRQITAQGGELHLRGVSRPK